MGLSQRAMATLREFVASPPPAMLARDHKRVFGFLRFRLLRQCVDGDGASTFAQLVDALDAERAAVGLHSLPGVRLVTRAMPAVIS
jgi:hypothetical protein